MNRLKIKPQITTGNQVFILEHVASNSYATISLENGASILELVMNGTTLISQPENLPYSESYAASLLFPFANRINNGTYNFGDKSYQLNCNQIEEGHAIHGLIYNKKFEIVTENSSEKESHITLKYDELNGEQGFPFKYSITVTYKLSLNRFVVEIQIKNTDDKIFPFSLGWHPYFKTRNLANSTLVFSAKQQFLNDSRNIPIQTDDLSGKRYLDFNVSKDDCYALNHKTVEFYTPDYNMRLENGTSSNYLQIFTPKQQNLVAIEPMTAAPDCFNNQQGLKTLAPFEIHKEQWQLFFEQPTNLKV